MYHSALLGRNFDNRSTRDLSKNSYREGWRARKEKPNLLHTWMQAKIHVLLCHVHTILIRTKAVCKTYNDFKTEDCSLYILCIKSSLELIVMNSISCHHSIVISLSEDQTML